VQHPFAWWGTVTPPPPEGDDEMPMFWTVNGTVNYQLVPGTGMIELTGCHDFDGNAYVPGKFTQVTVSQADFDRLNNNARRK
jgi:hypothetical protein